ncbi:MAG: sugar phosphate nucleotidyltransferase [Candidatus Neomarinimicrobiota bacterium]
MKGRLVILAGGIGSRMKASPQMAWVGDRRLAEEADERSKAMIGVGAGYRPFLDYLLYNAREAGYQDVVIVIGERDDVIRSYYGGSKGKSGLEGLRISYAIQAIPEGREKPLGTADALLQALNAREDWEGQKFTVCNSDNLYSTKALRLLLDAPDANAMIDYNRSALEFDEERIERFAVILKDERGYLRTIIEKPTREEISQARDPGGRIGVSMNIFAFSQAQILPVLREVPLHPVRKEKELPVAVNMLVDQFPRAVMTYPLSEHVPDLTSKEDLIPVRKQIAMMFKKVRL